MENGPLRQEALDNICGQRSLPAQPNATNRPTSLFRLKTSPKPKLHTKGHHTDAPTPWEVGPPISLSRQQKGSAETLPFAARGSDLSTPPQNAGEDPAPIRSTNQLESHRWQHVSLRQHRRATLDEDVESGEFRCFFRHINILNSAVC